MDQPLRPTTPILGFNTPPTGPNPVTPLPKKSKRPLWLGLTAGFIAILIGGGYFAYSKGYIAIPFLTPKTDELFDKMVASISDIQNAQYSARIRLQAEPRSSKATEIFIANTNSSNVNADSSTTTTTNTATTNSTGSTATPFSIESVGSTIGLPESSYRDTYLGALLGLAEFDELFQSVPGDIDFTGGITLFLEADKDIKEANGFVKLDGTYKGGDISVDMDVEARKIGKKVYGVVNKFPSFFFVDPSGIKGKWVALASAEGDDWIEDEVYDQLKSKEVVESLKQVLSNALKEKVFNVDRQLGNEMIAGVNSQHYAISVDIDKVPALYDTIIAEKKAKKEDVADFEKMRSAFDDPNVIATLKRIVDNSSIEIWVDKVNGFLRQTQWTLTIVPPAGNEKLAGKQFRLDFTVTMEKVNQKVSVSAPSVTIDMDEATRLLTGITREEQQFDKQRNQTSALQRALNAYIASVGSSPDSIADIWPKFVELDTACKDRAQQRLVNANSSTNAAFDYEKDYNCYSYASYTAEKLSIIDVYTNKPYDYAKNGATDYTVVYQMTLPTDSDSSYYVDQYSNGKNTMTRKDVSLEKNSPSDSYSQTDDVEISNTNSSTTPTNTSKSNTNSATPAITTPPDRTSDSDRDGLTDYTETRIYRTNPNLSDTDGDTHSDATEVTNRYNPLGDGAASAQQLLEWGVSDMTVEGAPKISNITVVTYGNGTGAIGFTTNIGADSVVNYGSTTSYGSLESNSALSTTHTLPISVITGEEYQYVIRACTAGKCTSTANASFIAK